MKASRLLKLCVGIGVCSAIFAAWAILTVCESLGNKLLGGFRI